MTIVFLYDVRSTPTEGGDLAHASPHANVTRKMALQSRLDSDASGPLYFGDVSKDRTLFSDQEIVGTLSARAWSAMARTRSVKMSL